MGCYLVMMPNKNFKCLIGGESCQGFDWWRKWPRLLIGGENGLNKAINDTDRWKKRL